MSIHAQNQPVHAESSRRSSEGAGWGCRQPADIAELFRKGYQVKQFSWANPKMLWASRNDRIARWLKDSTDEERQRWVQAQINRGIDPDFIIHDYADRDHVSFLMLGDTGEGDNSQYHVVRPLLSKSSGISFTYIVSDVIYPAGDAEDYNDKFFVPYQQLPGPIYAIPGNHDWYDGLHGFMSVFCDADPDQRPQTSKSSMDWKQKILSLVWRQHTKSSTEHLHGLRPQPPKQPAPYFAVELKDLLLVGIDPGIRGTIDTDQAAWLRHISALPKDKILITGKPLVANGERKTIGVSGVQETVNAIVANPAHRYIATIGGDIHNYQRYPARSESGHVIQHIVTGAGGAYTKATHTIPKVTISNCGCEEKDFRCYPLRGDSLAVYSILYDRKFGFGRGKFVVPRQEAPTIIAERLGGSIQPTRAEDRATTISSHARNAARVVMPLSKWSGPFHKVFSEFLDWDVPDPPLFKSFLRVDVKTGEISISCYGASGCAEQENEPPLEDHIRGTCLGPGNWFWESFPDQSADDNE